MITISLAILVAGTALAQGDHNGPPINYEKSQPRDKVAQLNERLKKGASRLEWDEKYGWLPSLLKNLKVSETSQTLVFSKTSLQIRKISPRRPRALYFNDEVYVGTVQHGDVIELSAVDPSLGAVFYSLDAKRSPTPAIRRTSSDCLSCHASGRTDRVPGYLVRSVFPSASGHPHFDLGTTTTDQTSDFRERFGGWYVTGKHGSMRHRGNEIADRDAKPPIDTEAGANVTDLSKRITTAKYLTPHSDLVALMVLQHQATMHNLITRASYEGRRAAHYDTVWNKTLERPAEHVSETSQRRIAAAGEKLLEHLFFSGEFRLTAPIEGTSDFANEFESKGRRDKRGRSLRDFDLQTRMFKHPCSFLIHSDSFKALPGNVRQYIDKRLHEILSDDDDSPAFTHLSTNDKTVIREILADTLPGFEHRR